MNDCPNADVRDLLPDLLHDRLDAGMRAMVEAHVAGCADCAAELELLRQLRATRRTPAVDVGSIVAAVPAYRTPARRSWVSWRAAAVITVMVAGASSVAVLQRGTPAATGIAAHAVVPPATVSVAQGSAIATPDTSRGAALPSHESSVKVAPRVSEPAPVTRAPATAAPVRELAMG